MDSFIFLKEECGSVRRALNETLRHDYGPARGEDRGRDYFKECKARLDSIEQAIAEEPNMDAAAIAAHMRALGALGSRISLIERSHLGEFSWPFSDAIRHIAEKLFLEKQLDDADATSPPIVHVIAEGTVYQIVDDALPLPGNRRILIVAFPRHFKHHVLLHSIFGHELCHAAFKATGPGEIIATGVVPALSNGGPLQDEVQATAWLKRIDAPESVKAAFRQDPNYSLPKSALRNWRIEIICDLFGLILFGPAFAAAHRTILEPISADPPEFDMSNYTHPPYLVRRYIVCTALRELGWNRPITKPDDGAVHAAEKDLLDYVSKDSGDAWLSTLFDGGKLRATLDILLRVFAPHPGLQFSPPDRSTFLELMDRLTLCRPPIVQRFEGSNPVTFMVPTSHCLYAGWSFWFGRDQLRKSKLDQYPRLPELSFLDINRLCDFALLQQCAINATLEYRKK